MENKKIEEVHRTRKEKNKMKQIIIFAESKEVGETLHHKLLKEQKIEDVENTKVNILIEGMYIHGFMCDKAYVQNTLSRNFIRYTIPPMVLNGNIEYFDKDE